jgi:hypothetical protein
MQCPRRLPPTSAELKNCGSTSPLPIYLHDIIIIIIIFFIDYVIRGLFRPLEKYAGPSILTEGILCFAFFLGCMSEFSSKSACLPFVARDISMLSGCYNFII